MGDTFKRFQKGQRLKIPAGQANAWTDAALAHRRRQGNRSTSFESRPPDVGLILIRNNSGEAVPRGGVLGIGDAIINPDDNLTGFLSEIAVEGELPTTADHTGKFAILLEPLGEGKIGRAVASGDVPALVAVESGEEDWGFVDVSEGDVGAVRMATTGGAQILWKESGTGEVWAYVRISKRSCPADNAKQRLTVIGQPTGGTLELDVTVPDSGGTPVTEEVELDYDDEDTEVKTNFETDHSEISDGGVIITGGPLPNVPIEIEFAGTFANKDIPLIRAKYGNLTGGTGTGAFVQPIDIGRP